MENAVPLEKRVPVEVTTFSDPFWDTAPRAHVERAILSRFEKQLHVAARTTMFRKTIPSSRLLEAGVPLTREAVESLPLVTKAALRLCNPDDLLPNPNDSFHMVRGTGGTSGSPVSVFWTRADWTAFNRAMLRLCKPLNDLGRLRFWNGYHQGHVSGPVFDDLARDLGGTPIPRHFRASDAQALEDIERLGANALIVTPQSGSGKGGSLEDLLAIDPSFLSRLKIRALLVSSTALQPEVVDEVRDQGVAAIVNFYGSTEAAPIAVSCEVDPTIFHLMHGHLFGEVVDANGRQVACGERGMVVVSRIGSESPRGLQPAGGTQLLRYLVGDSARYLDAPCSCGRTSPRISDLARETERADKLHGGCERWE